MDYKKIIAATAVTSAAIVVPVVAQAEGTENIEEIQVEFFESNNIYYGDTISESNLNNLNKIEGNKTSVEWIYGNTTLVNPSTIKIPLSAVGQTIKVVVTTQVTDESGNVTTKKYFDEITIKTKPTEVSYKYADDSSFNVDGKAIFDKKVKAIVSTLPDGTDAIVGYQWYIIDGTKYEAISGATTAELTIPYKANGKELALEVITEKGKHLFSEENLSVAAFELNEQDLKVDFLVNGKGTSDEESVQNIGLAPGDTVAVKNFAVKGMNGEVLSTTYYTVAYKWYGITKETGIKVLLSNAMSATYTIPTGSDSEYQGYYVQTVLSIPTLLTNGNMSFSNPYEGTIFFNTDPAEELKENIASLIDPNSNGTKYTLDGVVDNSGEFTDYQLFEARIKNLESQYEKLSTNSKKIVTNYATLQEATKDLQAVKPIISNLEKFDANYATAENHAEILKQYNTIQKSYNSLSPLQRSLVSLTKFDEEYLYKLQEWLKKSEDYSQNSDATLVTFNKVSGLNGKILSIIDTEEKAYNLSDYEDETILEDFTKKLKELTAEVKLIEKSYQPLIFTSIIKTAENDVKKAKAVITKIEQISKAATDAKKTSAIIAAKKAFDQLNPYQANIVNKVIDDLETRLTFTDSSNTEEQLKISNLIASIEELKADGMYTVTASKLEEKMNQLTADYKTLSAANKKLVNNYSVLTQAKKDLTAAKKAISLIEKAVAASELINASDLENRLKLQKSALTKYSAAYKAYIKLTFAQRSIVDIPSISTFINDYNELTIAVKTPVFKEDDEKADEKFDGSKSDEVSYLIQSIEDMINDKESLSTIELEITKAKSAYKALNSYEKKLVYNYAYLSVASSHVSKAKTVQKKLQAATESKDSKKIATAIATYKKLDAIQQGLIEEDYTLAEKALGISNDLLSDLPQQIAELIDDYTYENIYNISKKMEVLTTKEQKAIQGYSSYQSALKDLKAVDSFIAKVKKLRNSPSYSNKESIIKNYQKLTQNQILIFESLNNSFVAVNDVEIDYENVVANVTQWSNDLQNNNTELNTFIGYINVNGIYDVDKMDATSTSYSSVGKVEGEGLTFLDNFDTFLKNIEAAYKKLDAKEKKLVTNYSMIATAKKDSKAVRPVVELALAYEAMTINDEAKEAAFKKWNTAYSRLTLQQQSLFNLAITIAPTL